jgi:hypothetical protein
LLDANILIIGILVSLLVLITVTLRSTKAEEPLLILLGVSLIAYWFTLLHGGTIILPIPDEVIQEFVAQYTQMSVKANIIINITAIFLSAVCSAIIIMVKGALLIVN